MPYVLGIDIASTRTTAATCVNQGDGWGVPEPSWLGGRGPSAASAVFLDDDGYLLTGDAAVEAGRSAPARLLTGFHERIGDDVPVIVGGERFPAESLSAVLVDAAVDQAAERFGEKPRHIVITHPVGWGSFRRDLLRRALTEAGYPRAALVPAPIAALHAYLAPQGDVTAGICEFGPDGAVVTIATAGINGWQPVKTVEGVDPGEALGKVFELTHGAGIQPTALAGIVFCGEAPPVPGRTPCPVFASSDPVLTVATGAANIAARRDVPQPGGPRSSALAAVETVETTLLPRVDAPGELTERPERPPVDITPFPLPERTGAAKLLTRRKPLVAGAAVVVLAATTLLLTLTTREATAGKGPEAPSHHFEFLRAAHPRRRHTPRRSLLNALLDKPGIIHPGARRLLDEVTTAPELPVRVTVVAPGGHGKTHLLGLLGRHYAGAGVEALLVDDADQLGDDEIAKIKALAEETTTPVVLACRATARTKALRALADSFGRSVSLGAFGVDDVRRLVEYAGGDAATAEDVHARTGGVPGLVLRAVTGRLADFRGELEQLDDDVHRFLIAAEAGAGRNLDLLAALLNRDREGLPEIFDGARATGLLGEDDVLLPIAAEALRTWGSPGRRLTVLQRLVELQLRDGLPVLDLARSLLGTGSSGASAAAAFEAAAREAMPDDTKLAARLYEAASEAGGRGAALTVGWAHAAALAGDLDTALRLGDGMLGSTSDTDARAAGAEVAATVLAHRGELAHSAELYQWSGRAGSKAFAGIALLGTGKLEAARGVLETPEVPTLFAGAASRTARAITDSVSGCGAETLSALLGAASMLESAGATAPLPDSPAALAALVGLHSGELALAESVLSRAVSGRIGGDLLAKRHRLLLGWVAMTAGDLKTAAEALMPPEGLEARDELFAATLQLGLARRSSDLPGLQRSWDRAYQASMRQQPDLYSLLPLGELAIAAARGGASAKLAGQLERAHTVLDALGNPPLWTATLRWHELHAAITVENHASAGEHLAALNDFASCGRYPAALASAATGWLAVLTGTFDPEAITASASELHELGLCWDAARLAGQAAIRTSDRKAMVQLLEAARQFQGRAPEPVAATGLSALSERELEVARLVVDGLTYKQAGSKLFISGKTVEHHMARIRGKLGAGDRRELLAMLREMLPSTETDTRPH